MAMLMAGDKAPKTTSSPARMAAAVGGLLAVIVVLLCAFALPGVHSKPRGVPLAVVADDSTRARITALLDHADPGGFAVSAPSTEQQARQQILDRKVYGALVVGPGGSGSGGGLTLETASAASYTVSTALTQMAQQLGGALGVPVTVHDIRPFTARDPKGAGLTAGALPLALGGWIAAVAVISLIVGTRQRLQTAAAFAVAGGFALTGVLFAVGTFSGGYWTTSGAAVLGIAATCFLVLGLERLLRGAGIALAALVLIVLGNPLSGLNSAPELLPRPWGMLGQLLPPGATGTLLRNVSFFDGADIARPVIVLVCWLAVGLAAYALGVRRAGRAQAQG
jgi:hypothetical protein